MSILPNKEALQAIFTKRQIELIQKKLTNQELTPTERSYFSRSISKKLTAIQNLTSENKYFTVGEEFMLPNRKEKALTILKKVERNHKHQQILIGGSFLYAQDYQDIDIFIISKYEKEDRVEIHHHFNYLKPNAINSLFFNSLAKICVSNFNVGGLTMEETVSSAQIISQYQEVLQDFSNKNKAWIKSDLRNFVVECSYASQKTVLNSQQLRDLVNNILVKDSEKIIRKILVNTLILGFNTKEIKDISSKMITSYQELIIEYKHPHHYQKLIDSFKEVLTVAS